MQDNKIKMPLWGPYSKKYMGISRIIESLADAGARYDFSVHPTLWNSSTPVPNVTVPSSYHLWNCKSDYTYFSYRYELMWKDMVYADVSFSKINDEAYLMRCEFFNNTELSQNCILNIFASLEFPYPTYCKVNTPEKCVLKTANDYVSYDYAVSRPWDDENPDGMFKGMFADKDFYLGKGLGDRCENYHVHYLNLKPFGCEKGDKVSYEMNAAGFEKPVIAVRYKTVTDGNAEFDMNGEKVIFPHSDELSITYLPYKDSFTFESLGTAGIELDFLAVIEEEDKDKLYTEKQVFPYVPEIKTEDLGCGHRTSLTYDGIEKPFCILTGNKNTRERKLNSGCLEDALINRLSNGDHTYDDLPETFSGSFKRKHSDDGFFHNTLIKSIFIEPHTSHTEYAVLSMGEFEALSNDEYEQIYQAAKASSPVNNYNEAGKKYTLSTEILKSTLLTNVVYPVYRHGENVIHHTPGKRWDSFYTWDSGFIGMGLLEFSPKLCQYALDMYLCDETNKDFAFLLHGSLVPTQFAEYLELLKRTNDKESLAFLYDKAKLYYEFLRGRNHGSTFAKFNNGLLTAYDYWYSHCGMDDYPAQVEMMARKTEKYTCPCLTTAQVIRAGKIMKMVADSLGRYDDIKVYDEDIAYSTKALNELAWDEESGYFGYTLYDDNGNITDIMRTADGENFNKGMDGIYPLVAGAVTGERKKRLIDHIKNPNEMWSRAGISAVDMSASYYFDDGYWNGNVWMSHQWYVWKTMLDNGEADFAFEIANRALDMWKEETDFTYNTYECFGIATRRGGWFHNFGGLSAPICIWANCYYKPQTVTSGFDLWTDYQKTTDNSAEISFKYYGENEKYTMIVTLSDNAEYTAFLDGKEVEFFERNKGSLEFTFDSSVKSGVLVIKEK
ncbi:MAG: trehalase family glycosidase [Eubacteriales bacterium]|nr:trehalase family glycosidase [Eubacteriales bacterium]